MTTRKSTPQRPGRSKGQGREKRTFDKRGSRPKAAKKPAPEPAARSFAGDADKRGERIAKVMARAGLCSRREAETWIENGRVQLNGEVLKTPAITVTAEDKVLVGRRSAANTGTHTPLALPQAPGPGDDQQGPGRPANRIRQVA